MVMCSPGVSVRLTFRDGCGGHIIGGRAAGGSQVVAGPLQGVLVDARLVLRGKVHPGHEGAVGDSKRLARDEPGIADFLTEKAIVVAGGKI